MLTPQKGRLAVARAGLRASVEGHHSNAGFSGCERQNGRVQAHHGKKAAPGQEEHLMPTCHP